MKSDCPSIHPALRVGLVANGMIAHHPAKDAVHYLNLTGALILTLCDGRHEVGEIKAAVLNARTNASGQRLDTIDVEAWLDRAATDGLVVFDQLEAPALREMDADELAGLAKRLRDTDQITRAYQCQRRATELAPEKADLWRGLGEFAQVEGDRDAARAAYARYLELAPNDAAIAHLLTALSDDAPPARASDECIRQMFDEFSEHYDQRMRNELAYRAPEELREVMAELLPREEKELRVLDLGCGTGLSGEVFKPWSRTLEGVDLSPEMAARARERGVYDAVHVAELTDWLSRAPRTYDLIVSCDVFVYLGDLTTVIEAASRVLSPGGWIAFSVERSTEEPWTLTDSGRYAHGPGHIRSVARSAGLEVVLLSEKKIRAEYSTPVIGLIVVLGRSEHREQSGS